MGTSTNNDKTLFSIFTWLNVWQNYLCLGTCQKLAGGEGGVETQGGSQLFETQKREGSRKMGRKKGEDHANICPWSCRGSPTEEK